MVWNPNFHFVILLPSHGLRGAQWASFPSTENFNTMKPTQWCGASQGNSCITPAPVQNLLLFNTPVTMIAFWVRDQNSLPEDRGADSQAPLLFFHGGGKRRIVFYLEEII